MFIGSFLRFPEVAQRNGARHERFAKVRRKAMMDIGDFPYR